MAASILLVAAAGIAAAVWLVPPGKPKSLPLDGKLTVFVRPHAGAAQPRPVEDSGALPVQAGGSMSLEIDLNEPAFIYLVWLDAEGNVVPLYPWNTDKLEVKDISQPLPERRATKKIFSPLVLGGGWLFGKNGGTETVLLLARRTPLPGEVKLGSIIRGLSSPPKPDRRDEVIAVRVRGPGTPGGVTATAGIRPKDLSLATFVNPLADHFELIHAVQFAHADEPPR